LSIADVDGDFLLIRVMTPPNGLPCSIPDSRHLTKAELPKAKYESKCFSKEHKFVGVNQCS